MLVHNASIRRRSHLRVVEVELVGEVVLSRHGLGEIARDEDAGCLGHVERCVWMCMKGLESLERKRRRKCEQRRFDERDQLINTLAYLHLCFTRALVLADGVMIGKV